MISKPKKQHYVQRAYLDQWSDSSGNIFICDLNNGNIHSGPAKSAAWQKYYYNLKDPKHPELEFEIEEFLGRDIEGPAKALFEKLSSEDVFTTEEKNKLAWYIAFQKVRVPFFEKSSNKLAEKLDKENLLKILEDKSNYDKFLIKNQDKYKLLGNVPTRENLINTIKENRVRHFRSRS
ncbi:MAG TPA: DUF4238 domain-containing protein [Coxiellaceae bacterium]|nr:DUF4238 domain-containing protein [Coxiellaceae bacterium]